MDDVGGADADAVVGSAFFGDDFVGFVAGFVFDFGEGVFGEQSGERLAGEVGCRPKGEFTVAVFGDLEGMDGFGMDI